MFFVIDCFCNTKWKFFRFLDMLPESVGLTDWFSGGIIFSANVISRGWAGFSVVATSHKI